MPIYEYTCPACGEPFEELVLSAARADDVECPNCGSRKVKRKLSTFAARVSGGTRGSAASSSAACAPGGT